MTDDPAQSTVVDAEPAQRVGGTRPVSRAERARRTAYRSRFAAVYVVLAAVVGVAVGSFIVLASREDPPPPAICFSRASELPVGCQSDHFGGGGGSSRDESTMKLPTATPTMAASTT